jgi:dTDP-4-amino-4,6-dideoxygalactose transaminase
MKTKFPFGKPILSNSENYSIKKVLDSNILVHGPITNKFEIFLKNLQKLKKQ